MLLIEMSWSRNSFHSACLAWASLKWASGTSARRSPCSGCVMTSQGRAVQRGTSRPRCHAPGTATSHSRPPASPAPLARARGLTRVGSSIGPTRGGASSSVEAPAAPWSPVGRLSGQACPCPWGGAWGTSACDVAAAASSCCGLATAAVTRDGSPVAAALPAGCGALSERRLFFVGVLDLSAFAGARAGRSASPCQQEIKRLSDLPSKSKAREGRCWPPQIGESLLPLPRGLGVPSSRPLAPPWCLLAPPPMAQRRALPRPPQVPIHGHFLGPWRRRWGIPPIGGDPPPITLLLLIRRRVRRRQQRGESLLLAQPVLLVVLL
jgi:hypothetical protein